MHIHDIPVPEIYKSSSDFRLFLRWFDTALEKIQYDTENLSDIYDPLKCPEDLLWCLADTMGYKYDDRLPTAFNRLVLLYFMSMIYNRGSRNGMILAAETNLAQFTILDTAAKDEILYNRLENTAIPTNSVSVTAHTAEGYIDVVYFSTEAPKDACIEYVRPVGMYVFQRAGVAFDSAKTKISVDASLTNSQNMHMTFGPTQVGHYRRSDYATLQKMHTQSNFIKHMTAGDAIVPVEIDTDDTRNPVWNRNSAHEVTTDPNNNPGYRALQSLQLSNNEEIMNALLPPIFTIGPEVFIDVKYPDDYYKQPIGKDAYNLRYDITTDQENTRKNENDEYDIFTIDVERSPNAKYAAKDPPQILPMPAVNPVMTIQGDAISLNTYNTEYYGDEYVTNESDYIYEKDNSYAQTVFYLSSYTKLTLPTSLDGAPVNTIRATTFYNTSVNKIIIPDGITEIE